MRNTILILEDDDARLKRLRDVLQQNHSTFAVRQWPDAHGMISELDSALPSAALLSLDHDLYVKDPDAPDPGDGLDVAKFLAQRTPCCPVIIHSSNSDRARMMQGELDLAGWSCQRVQPLGDDWVERYWGRVVAGLLKSESNRR